MTSLTRTPVDDALTCISCGVPHTTRPLDRSHVIPRSRDPSRVDDPSNIVRQCRPCHTEIEPNRMARHKVEDGVYTYEVWSNEDCDFIVGRRVKVKVDKRRGHLLEAGSAAADLAISGAPVGVPDKSVASAAAPSASGKGEDDATRFVERPVGLSKRVPVIRRNNHLGDTGGVAGSTADSAGPAGHPSVGVASRENSAAEAAANSEAHAEHRTAHGGSLAAPFSLEIWKEQGAGLLEMEETIWNAAQAIQFAKGDWFLDGEQHLGEEVYGHLDTIRSPSGKVFRPGTLMQYIWVAKNVAPSTRVLAPSWAHCRAVAALPEPEQKERLEKAREENLSSKGLYRAIHGEKPRVKRWSFEELEDHLCHTCRAVVSLMEAK